jgi:hypothetical protein
MVYQKEKQFRDNDYKKINTSANMFRFEIFFWFIIELMIEPWTSNILPKPLII